MTRTRRKNQIAFRPMVGASSLEDRVALSGVSQAAALVAQQRQIIAQERRANLAEQQMMRTTTRSVTQAFTAFERAFRRDQGAFLRAENNGSTTAAATFQANIASRLNVLANRLNSIFAGLPAGTATLPTTDALTGTGATSLLNTLNGLNLNTLGRGGFMAAAQSAIATARTGMLSSLNTFTASIPSALTGTGLTTGLSTGLSSSSLSSLIGTGSSLSLTGMTTGTGTSTGIGTGVTTGTGSTGVTVSAGGDLSSFQQAFGNNVFQSGNAFQGGTLSLVQTITQGGTVFQNGSFFQNGTGTGSPTFSGTGSLTGTGTGTGTTGTAGTTGTGTGTTGTTGTGTPTGTF